MRVNFINLTNGIEAIPFLPPDFHYIRIQSTMCEQQLWDQILMGLDNDFLMNVALGNECVVYDFGHKKPISRAVFQGIEFIRYALHRRWLGIPCSVSIRRNEAQPCGKDCTEWFEQCYQRLNRKTRHRLDFFLPYFRGRIHIDSICSATEHDGDKDWYVRTLHEYQDKIQEIGRECYCEKENNGFFE